MKFDEVAHDLRHLRLRNWHRVWEPFMSKYECDYICEIGVCEGINFNEMIAHNPKRAVAVDIWKDDGIPSHNDGRRNQAELDEQYKTFKKVIKGKDFVEIVREYSDKAVKKFTDNYFDFVYIDADHSYDGCYSDITNWYPKVKPGKFLVGHDYRRRYGVFEAVNKFVRDNNLELIFLQPSTWAVIKKRQESTGQIVKDLGATRWKRRHYVWEPFMSKYNCEVICEIGVQYGYNFQEMIKHGPKIAVAVDPWIDDGVMARNDGGFSQKELDRQYKDFIKSVNDKPFVKVYREYSFDAVKDFDDNYFDLVYIDGDHSYEGCLRDIENWYPKVKTGGFLVGDDFREWKRGKIEFGVIDAVSEFAGKNYLDVHELPNSGWVIIK